MTTHTVELNLPATGRGGTVLVDGEDVAKLLEGVQVDARANQLVRVALILRAGVDVPAVLDGCEVTITKEEPADPPVDVILAFLNAVAGPMLEADVLNSFQLGDSQRGTMDVALEVLKGYARGLTT